MKRGAWWLLAVGVMLASPLSQGEGGGWGERGESGPLEGREHRGSTELPALGVTAVAMTVSELDRAVAFYRDVLGFTPGEAVEVRGPEVEQLQGIPGARLRVAPVHLGEETLLLMDFLTPEGRPIPRDARSNDLSFQHVAIVVRDMDAAYEQVRRAGVTPVSHSPQRLPEWNPAAGGIWAFYFRDPDGHVLELIQFPAGKGDPRWQRPSARLFLGIDHTAIAVSDTERSLGFYRDALGMQVVGASENFGPEQERLNAVPGAHLRITSLRAGCSPTPAGSRLSRRAPRSRRSRKWWIIAS
ncbi:MAG: VOC family protein, partial [Myxococcaceae bacterium]|nr:VOC family protein [Myxococcaceae bacterium]